MTALASYFHARGVSMLEIAPGVVTPRCFTAPAAEHKATRRACGMFDFSFMACIEIRGEQSLVYLHRLQTRNLTRLERGRIAYTLMLREDGMLLNDATVWCFGDHHYALFVGRRDDLAHVRGVASSFDVTLTVSSDDHAVIALQGAHARQILARCIDDAPGVLPYFSFWAASFKGAPCWVARLGYSGETGYEIIVNNTQASTLWADLLDAGAPLGVAECGFDAVNSLRIEAGHVLFSAELASPVTPRELGFERLVDVYAGNFIGKDAFLQQRWKEPARRYRGFVIEQHGHPPHAGALKNIAGNHHPSAIHITSCCHSPTLDRVIALGFARGERAEAGARFRLAHGMSATVARLPFYDPAKHLVRHSW